MSEQSFGEKVAVQTASTIFAAVAVGILGVLVGIPPEPNTCLGIGAAITGGSSS